MPPVDRRRGRVDAWVFAVDDPRRLAGVRIGLCSVLVFHLLVTDYAAVAGLPSELFQPRSYMTVLDGMPSSRFAAAVQLVAVGAALLAAAGVVLRVSLPVAIAGTLVLDGMVNSAGRVIVGDALLVLCLLVLAGAGRAAAEAWTVERAWAAVRGRPVRPALRGTRYGWPIRTAMLVVALAYFCAGYQKWRHSGLAWVTSDNIRWVLYASAEGERAHGLGVLIADRPVLAHLLAAGAITLETAFPLVLVLRRSRWLVIGAAIAMHLTIQLTLGLDYSAQWLTMVVVFADWPTLTDRLRAAIPRATSAAGVGIPGS
jgi:hypothetical protein